MEHFKILARDQFKNRKRTENEILRFWGISKNYAYAITWQNQLSRAFLGITYYLPYDMCNNHKKKKNVLFNTGGGLLFSREMAVNEALHVIGPAF